MSSSESDFDYTLVSDEENSSSNESTIDSDSEELEDFSDERDWYPISVSFPPVAPPRFPFMGSSSLNFDIADKSDILSFLKLFIDQDLLKIIADETNKKAAKCRNAKWTPTNPGEIMVFIAINIAMGFIRKPSISLYWAKRKILATPFFARVMPRDRFLLIKKYLHFYDESTFDHQSHPSPKLSKIWPIFDHVNKKCQQLYTPDRDVTIDESLMMYKGRLHWKQYIPLKRARFRIKLYLLCESETGYILYIIIYTGKGTIYDPEFKDYPSSTQIVMTMMKPYLGQGYCLTTDNFYTSPQLADMLINHKTDTYGTVRPNRKEMPPELSRKKLNKGDILAFQRGKLLALRWRDKKDVYLLSTMHSTNSVQQQPRFPSSSGSITKPAVVVDYNHTMGGVDRVDQHLSDNPIIRKRGKVYYKKLFFHLLEFAIWKAFLLYKKTGNVGLKLILSFECN